MIMIMAIVIKGNYYYAKQFPRILWCFFFNIFYNVDNFIPRRMSDNVCHYNICHDNKITFCIKYLPMSHQVMTSLIT